MSWATAPLGEIATVERNSISPADIESGSRYVGLDHIESGGRSIRFGSVENGELASSKFRFGPHQILFGKLRPYLAKIVCPDFAGICSTDIVPISPGKRVEKRYLLHFLRRPETIAWAAGRATGVNLPRLSPKELASLEIPLPPLDKQRRIAAILDKADALRRKRKRAIELIDEALLSVFLARFGDPVVNPKSWRQAPISHVCKVVTGNTPPRENSENFGSYIEWIKSDNINPEEPYVSEAAERLSESAKSKARIAPRGSILITCIAGSPNSIGNAALTDREVSFNQQINALIPTDIDVLFLYHQIRAGKRLIQNASTGGMKGLVSKSRLEQVFVMCPPLDLQRKFSSIASKFISQKAEQRDSLSKSEALFSSLQHRAFSGQL